MSDQPPIIEATNLVMQFDQHRALDSLNLSMPPGVTGLVGANGAGKTTLMSLLLGLQFPTAGTVRVLGLDPVTEGTRVRSLVGFSPERNLLPDDMKANDYVRHLAEVKGLPPKDARTRASDSLFLVGLGEERFRLLGTMSTGQRQRVKLAQAIAASPKLLLLDEPTDGLDPMQRESMLALIASVSRDFGINILLSTHLLEEVEQVCTNVVALNAGRLVASGPVESLLGDDASLRFELTGPIDLTVCNHLIAAIEGPSNDAHVTLDTATTTFTVTSTLPPDAIADRCRDAIATGRLPLRSFGANRRRLEDLFTDTIAVDHAHGQGPGS